MPVADAGTVDASFLFIIVRALSPSSTLEIVILSVKPPVIEAVIVAEPTRSFLR